MPDELWSELLEPVPFWPELVDPELMDPELVDGDDD